MCRPYINDSFVRRRDSGVVRRTHCHTKPHVMTELPDTREGGGDVASALFSFGENLVIETGSILAPRR